MVHITIYGEPGRYAGWPANYGIWNWGDEIVVGFTVGYHSNEGGFHARDRSKPFIGAQARSLDGGESWVVAPVPAQSPGGRGLSADEHVRAELQLADAASGLTPCPGEITFTHPDFALMCARNGLSDGAVSFFYLSDDRCQLWHGPYALPSFGLRGIAARTDYLVSGPKTCTLLLTSAKSDGDEGRTFCARTTDGGATFEHLGWIGDEPAGFSIMPASVRLPDGALLAAVRCRGAGETFDRAHNWIDLYRSDDDGRSWRSIGRPVANTGRGGNPPTMLRLRDGRLCMTYGVREAPYRMCAKLSSDGGASWTDEIALRDDGGGHDIGYPRTVQRADGSVVTIYYWHSTPEGERHIAATVWEP